MAQPAEHSLLEKLQTGLFLWLLVVRCLLSAGDVSMVRIHTNALLPARSRDIHFQFAGFESGVGHMVNMLEADEWST